MNILQIVPELRSGGVERGTVDFAKYLTKQGHRSVIVSAGGPLVHEVLKSGAVHYLLPVQKKSLFSILKCARALSDLLLKERIELVHARSRVPAWIALLACRKARIPMITTCHGIYNTHFLSRVMGWGKFVIAISHAVSLHMKERFNLPYDRIRLIHRGVNLEEFQWKDRQPRKKKEWVIGIIGRITPIKGHLILLKAIARVIRVYPKARLQIVGDAPRQRYLDELVMLARRLGIERNVQFLGTRHDIPQLIEGMDLLVAPAVGEEAFGRVLIEAGACGVPVIASRIGGIVDIIEHESNGLLVPAGDAPRLAEAITHVLDDPAKAHQYAVNLRKKVEGDFHDKQMFERTLEVYRQALKQKKILILKLSALGDTVLSIPSIRAIRGKFPEARIAVVVERASREIVRNCPYVDEVYVYEPQGVVTRWFQLWKLSHFLRREQYDICVDLQNNRSSHLLAYLSGAHTRIGYANRKFSFFLNSKVRDMGFSLAPVDHQFQALKLLGFTDMEKKLELWTQPHDDQAIESFLKEHWLGNEQVLVGIHPMASHLWPSKRWLVERMVELCDRLSGQNVRVVITGDVGAKSLAREISRKSQGKVIDATGKTNVSELVALIRRCDVFLTPDSAPLHIAQAVKTPFITLFGPTDPGRHISKQGQFKVIRRSLKCSPCYLRVCPIGHPCMKQISVDEVHEQILKFIEISSKNSCAHVDKT
jgi:lipopolysaccharide heptosyltransferase II